MDQNATDKAVERILEMIEETHRRDFLDFVLEGKLSEALRSYLETSEQGQKAADHAMDLVISSFDGVRKAFHKR